MTESARRRAPSKPKAADDHGPARSHWIGTITRTAIGPFAAWGNDTGMAAWLATSERTGDGELVVVPIGADGAPLRSPQVVTTVPREATSLVIRPTRQSHGWLIAWTALLDRGESLTVIELAADGTARDKPSDVQRTRDHIAWADIVPTPRGALCVWAEETAAGTANLLAGSIGPDGKPRGMPARVARGVSRWGVTPAEDGAALALVTGEDNEKTAGRLSWLELDAEGAAKGAPVLVTPEPSVDSDVEVAAVAGGWVLGWTDRTGEDARVMLASVDAAGHPSGPFPALNELGGSSLVALTAAGSGVALAWESPRTRGRSYRVLHLASVPAVGPLVAQPVTSMRIVGSAKAELVPAGDGFGLLTVPTGVCVSGDAPLPDCPAVPTFVRYDGRLATLQAEPFLVGDPRVQASLGWGLHCAGDRCIAMAATSESPTPIFAVDLAPRTSPFAPPAAPASPADAPRAIGITTLVSGPPYGDVAAVRVGGATLVATMTSAVDVPDAPPLAHVASVVVRAYDDAGKPVEQPHTLTSRALPVGRVALAVRGAGDKLDPSVAAAWVVRDDGDPQVHVATLDARGHRIKEVQLTTARGDAGDVAIAPVEGGWLVAWVDWRDGNGEVYAAKLDRDLGRLSPDQRITHSPGDKADVTLASAGSRAWVAWSDPRESPREGVGDVYVTTLGARDAKRASDEVRVLATAAHSRSPAVEAVGTGALVAWIEDAPPGVDAPGAALFARLDETAHVRDTGALELAESGRPTALALEGSPAGTRVVLATAAHEVVTLDAAVVKDAGATARAWPLVDLDAPGAFDVAVALAGGALVYDDVGATAGERRVRSMAIGW
jgi:hypothetical protein